MLRRFWRLRRRQLAVVALGLAVLAATVAAGADEQTSPFPTRAQVCGGAQQAAKEIPEQHPGAPQADLDAMAKELCAKGATRAPVPPRVAERPTPGCHMFDQDKRPRRVRPRTAVPPRRQIPFFAARSGELPPNGTPAVGGIRLPRGSRCGPFWSTDAGVQDAFGLARNLASRFSSTGLWPVLWTWSNDPPDGYVNGPGNPARADSLGAESVLRGSLQGDGAPRFRGLAQAGTGAGPRRVDPFGEAMQKSSLESPPPGGWIVMLVPVNRPADVYSVLRPNTTEYFSDYALTAVLRSWEERFGTVVAALTPSTVELAVAAEPRDAGQARRLAVEQAAFAPEDDGTADLDALASQLRSSRTARGMTSARYWAFGWPD